MTRNRLSGKLWRLLAGPRVQWGRHFPSTLALSGWLLVVVSLPLPMRFAAAQEPDDARAPDTAESPVVNPLASKEEMIRDRFQRFGDRVFRLRDQLGSAEPDNASRLGRVLQRAGELGLSDQLDELIELLSDPASLNDAVDVQGKWLADADRLLAILLQRDSENEERRLELQRLREYSEKLNQILKAERELRDATAQAAAAGRMTRQLEQALQRVAALLDRQAKISAETASPQDSKADSEPAQQLADRQTDLSRDTKQLAEDLKRLAEMQPAASSPSNAATAPSAAESADSSSQKAAQQKTRRPRRSISAAAASTKSGANAMKSAGDSLKKSDVSSAQQQQQEATQALRKAQQQLEEAKRQLEDAVDLDEMTEEQGDLADQTGDLSEQMQQDAESGSGQGPQGGQAAQGQSSQPGRQSLDQAQSEMNDASESLGESKPQEATQSEDRAIDQLEQARKELEEALNQLRKEEREETLRDLESRFRQMLSSQRAINDATLHLDEVGSEDFKRAQHLELAELSAKEQELSQEASSCLHILDEDGTTIVFPRVVGQLSEDMGTVAGRLGAYQVAAITQTIEQEIVDTLEQLLGAIQRMQQENEQQPGSSGSSDDSQSPLLPQSAELKLLRASQVRINTRTAVLESAGVEQDVPDDALAGQLQTIAMRQKECAGIAEEMRDRKNQP